MEYFINEYELLNFSHSGRLTEEQLQIYLENNIDINFQNKFGDSALMNAMNIHYPQKKTVELLLKYGANPNTLDRDGNSILLISYRSRLLEIFKILLKYGANPNFKSSGYSHYPLIEAIKIGDNDTIKLLIDNNADINCKDSYNNSILMIAVASNFISSVKMVLNYDINHDLQNVFGNTALMIACEGGFLDIIKILLKYSINCDLQNYCGNTALMIACKRGYLNVVKILLKYGANPYIRNNSGDNVLTISLDFERKKTLKYLLKHKKFHHKMMKLKKINLNEKKINTYKILSKF